MLRWWSATPASRSAREAWRRPQWSFRFRSSWATRPSTGSRRRSGMATTLPADAMTSTATRDVLPREGVRLGQRATDKWDALRQSGALLEELGAVEDGSAAAILEREASI